MTSRRVEVFGSFQADCFFCGCVYTNRQRCVEVSPGASC